ncbi:MAG: hypothetical protein J6Z02_04775 [Lachnospiraceae bacterium]|nr:hypothetical protein [Lachnospiraceae bacterium]
MKEKTVLYILRAVSIVAVLICCIALGGGIAKFKEKKAFENSRVLVYEGPALLKEATEEDLKNTSEKNRKMDLLKSTDTEVRVNGTPLFVYETNVNHTRSWVSNYYPPQSRTPVTYFDFTGAAKVEIKTKAFEIKKVKVSPLSENIKAKTDKKEGKVSFVITKPGAYTVIFNDSPERAIHLFAGEIDENAPDKDEEGLIYFGPGEWDIGQVSLETGQRVYIAGGAVVHGCFSANYAHDIVIDGRGILDGSLYEGWKGREAYIPLKFDHCREITIKGITVLNSNAWVCQAFDSEKGLIDGVKIISSRPNGDGISLQSCKDYEVRNCFVRSWDDSLVVKNYDRNSENITFTGCTLWTDLAQSMEIGYETNKGKKDGAYIKDITFKNVTVVNNFHKPVISVHNADDALISGVLFEDITVEHEEVGSGDGSEMPYLIDINIARSSNWSSTKERGKIDGVTLKNVNFLSGNECKSRVSGFDEDHMAENIFFENVTIFGKKIKNGEDMNLVSKEGTVRNIIWK